MHFSSKKLEEAVEAFAGLPGIGRKTALRLALHLVQRPEEETESLSEALLRMRREIQPCQECFNLSDEPVCSICANPRRDRSLICVVESIRDVMAIEDTGQYRGLYHVLGGVISPIEGIGPEQLTIHALVDRAGREEVQEVIFAISPTIEGDTTIFYLSRQLKDKGVRLSTLARGVSFGGELAYADELTLGRSIVSRQPYQQDAD